MSKSVRTILKECEWAMTLGELRKVVGYQAYEPEKATKDNLHRLLWAHFRKTVPTATVYTIADSPEDVLCKITLRAYLEYLKRSKRRGLKPLTLFKVAKLLSDEKARTRKDIITALKVPIGTLNKILTKLQSIEVHPTRTESLLIVSNPDQPGTTFQLVGWYAEVIKKLNKRSFIHKWNKWAQQYCPKKEIKKRKRGKPQ